MPTRAPTAAPGESDIRGADRPLTAGQIRARVAQVRFWWHTIDLGHGVVTPGKDRSEERLARLALPDSLARKSVLDIGAWDGFFSFAAERRGAARVVACDTWDPRNAGESDAGFRLAREVLGSSAEQARLSVHEVSPERLGGTFDVVLLLGVLYHLEDPIAALRRVRSVTREVLILDTETDMLHVRRPAWGFYPDRELRGDPTNWFAPNLPALRGALLAAGFSSVRVVWRTNLRERAGRALRDRSRFGSGLWAGFWRGRAIVHAHV